MSNKLSRRAFLQIGVGVVAGALTGFKVAAGPVVQESPEDIRTKVFRVFDAKGSYADNKYIIKYMVPDDLLADCKIDLEKYIKRELSDAMAAEIDRQFTLAYYGVSKLKPIGILGASR